jgi:hypothetical protein
MVEKGVQIVGLHRTLEALPLTSEVLLQGIAIIEVLHRLTTADHHHQTIVVHQENQTI